MIAMAATTEELKAQLASLPIEDRAELAHYLIDTLDEAFDPDAEAAWDVELKRRGAQIRSGTAAGEAASSNSPVASLWTRTSFTRGARAVARTQTHPPRPTPSPTQSLLPRGSS